MLRGAGAGWETEDALAVGRLEGRKTCLSACLAFPAHFSEEEKVAQSGVLPQDWRGRSLCQLWAGVSSVDYYAVLGNCFNPSGPQFLPLSATQRELPEVPCF